jgi:hypothetical protein
LAAFDRRPVVVVVEDAHRTRVVVVVVTVVIILPVSTPPSPHTPSSAGGDGSTDDALCERSRLVVRSFRAAFYITLSPPTVRDGTGRDATGRDGWIKKYDARVETPTTSDDSKMVSR